MATEAHKLQVGVFVIVAAALGVGAAIWLGATRFFEETRTFVTYFSESVQGLDPGAAVKYRGVPAGRIAHINIAPDGNLIEVVMDVDTKIADVLSGDKSLRARLELSGITGLRFLEIDRRSGPALTESPQLSFEPPHELIPSSRSSVKAIQEAFGDVYERVMAVDLQGMSNDARSALQAANQLLRDENVKQTLANLRRVSDSASQLTENLERITAGVKLGAAVDNLSQAATETRAFVVDLRTGELSREIHGAVSGIRQVAQSSQQFVEGLHYTVERLDRTIGNLERLTDEIRDQPSLLLFSEPPPPRQPAQGEQR